MMYSQRDEEKFILRFFREVKGRFLDIGAYDGKCFSTTHALALKGWSGVCVEPSPSVLPALKNLYKDNPAIEIWPIAISEVSGKRKFYDSGGDAISSFDEDHVKLWKDKGAKNFTEIEVVSQTIQEFFDYIVSPPFDFINIDAEGLSLYILKNLPYSLLDKTKMICVEFDHKEKEVNEILHQYGFNLLHRTAENLILVR